MLLLNNGDTHRRNGGEVKRKRRLGGGGVDNTVCLFNSDIMMHNKTCTKKNNTFDGNINRSLTGSILPIYHQSLDANLHLLSQICLTIEEVFVPTTVDKYLLVQDILPRS